MAELINLWDLVQDVQLYQITCRWKTHGIYTAKSAYNAQFKGAYHTFNSQAIWSVKYEGKHRFFAWILIQCKILTADRLIARNWPCKHAAAPFTARSAKCGCCTHLHSVEYLEGEEPNDLWRGFSFAIESVSVYQGRNKVEEGRLWGSGVRLVLEC
jgi:hypothetical protein